MLKLIHCRSCFAASHLRTSSRGSGLAKRLELLGGLEDPAQLVSLLCVCVVIRRQDGTEDACTGILEVGGRAHPDQQPVERIAKGPEDQFDLPGAARDIVVLVVGISDRETVPVTEDLRELCEQPNCN